MAGSALLKGFVGGVIATAPMTLCMMLMRRVLDLPKQAEKLPPQEITENVVEGVNAQTPAEIPKASVKEKPGEEFSVPTLIAHYGYGGAAGSLYLPLLGAPAVSPVAKGMLYGIMVWTGSYMGLLPAVKLYPKASEKPSSLNVLMLTAHLVWGGALGWFCERGNVRAST